MTRTALFGSLLLVRAVLAQEPIRGFPPREAREQAALEKKLRTIPESDRLRTYMKRMSAEPHHAGSPGSRAVAEYAHGLLREWGLDAKIEKFEALIPYPGTRVVEMTAPVKWRAKLQEPAIPEDADSGDANQLAAFHAYSASGDITAPLVYVNYGLPEDYDVLKRLGVDVRGKIVIARYGKSWRGTKPRVAQERGASACIIYSDPKEDGYYQGDVYPKGPFRPADGVQRGSVLDMPLYVGDPLTPGWASEPGSKRLPMDQAQTIMKIPVLPMSYADAAELLRYLGGQVAPEGWRGALGFTYHVGPGPATVHLKLDFDWATRPLYDVIATIPGSTYAGQWVIYGNHHDAWVNGANDPISGASALLETARVLAELRKTGWQPKRTIKLALWDGEEFGLIGSTEWVEKHRSELSKRAVAYINSDSTGKGRLNAGGSPSLESFLGEVLRDTADPVTGKPLAENKPLQSLGAGSDYVPFLHHAGIASLNLGFGADGAGVYHSIYDTFEWYSRFSDGNFAYGRTLSTVMATVLARLSEAPVLPFEFTRLAKHVETYMDEIQKNLPASSKLDLQDLQTELRRLNSAAKNYEADLSGAMVRAGSWNPDKLKQLNEEIFRTERALTLDGGLPGRNWYRHQIYAPGSYTGYSAKTLPGVREAAEAGRITEATEQGRQVAKVLRRLRESLVKAAEMLRNLQ